VNAKASAMSLENLLTDFRYAVRQLVKSRGFTVVVIVTLALGIGACTVIFSVVNGVLLRPLNYPAPDRVVTIKETQLPEFPDMSVSVPNFLDWQQQAKSFSHIAAFAGAPLNLTNAGEPQQLRAINVTAHFFDVLQVQPKIGRTFTPEEGTPGKDHVVVLGEPACERLFGGTSGILGRQLQLNDEMYTVVGVIPAGFGYGVAPNMDAFIPMAFRPDETTSPNRGLHKLITAARLKPGVTVAAADAEMKLIAAQLAARYPETNKRWSAFVMPLLDYWVSNVRVLLYTLLGAVGFVLLIACANVANLLLTRALSRHREFSVRAALGASRARLVRQLMTETLLLALAGGAAGVLLAHWSLKGLLVLAPAVLPRTHEIRLDGTVLAVCLVLSVCTGLLFGLAPAWLASRVEITSALKAGARGTTESRSRGRLRGLLVIIQVALALTLLAGAGLLGRSFARLTRVDPGFTPGGAVVLRFTLPEKKYPQPEQQVAFADKLLERVRSLPGVQSAGVAQPFPFFPGSTFYFNLEGRPWVSDSELPNSSYYAVTADYFHALGIRLVRGRVFTAEDRREAPRVAIINETLARRHFGDQDPLRKRIASNELETWREIVGVVADIREGGIEQRATNQVYEPFAQSPRRTINLLARSSGASTTDLVPSLRAAVYSIDKDQPVPHVRTLDSILDDYMAAPRFSMLLLAILSASALVIASVGIYGVTSYTAVQRTGEFGIRMAIGAQRRDVLRLVLWQGAKLVLIGLLAGLTSTLVAGRVLTSMLFETSPYDPATLATITILLGAIAVLACLLPAYRATRINPIDALRAE
jgi:putative ABC transport system permease protein